MRHTAWLCALFCLACGCTGSTRETSVAPTPGPQAPSPSADARDTAGTPPSNHGPSPIAQKKSPSPPKLPPAPAIPQRPTPLEVEDWRPASHVGPDAGVPWPAPVAIVLHGNYDRPEWECDLWKEVAGFYGWLLCPRGVRSSPVSEDRWKYASRPATRLEIDASLAALEARYPGRVTREGMMLVGFSLGAIMAPDILQEDAGRYDYVFFVEGGMQKLVKIRPSVFKKVGLKGAGFAMSGPWRRKMAKRFLETWPEAGIKTVFVDMEGAGHGYRRDFPVTGHKGLKRLLGDSE